MKKRSWLVAGFSALLALGMTACGDDDSSFVSPAKKSTGDYCEIVSDDPLVVEASQGGYWSKTTIVLEKGKVRETIELKNSKMMNLACADYKSDTDYASVTCEDNTVVAVGDEDFSARDFERFKQMIIDECSEFNESDDVLSSSSNEVRSSSSSVRSSSSSQVRSSSSQVPSSSSYVESSSSQVESSSSQGYSAVEITPISSSSKIEGEKVVASNADELDCPEEEPADLTGFDVAYEFSDPYDMGHDYVGKENAYLKAGVPTVSAECNAMVLDGTNGLYIPLSDVFKNKGFVFEVRFMPLQESSMGNIFVAEPPGSGKTGWQLRLDGDEVRFHFRDAEMSSSWNTSTVGEVTLNEWHVVRVKIFPAKSELSGVVFYSLNLSLDGSIRYASEFKADLSKLEFNLGIGYDSMNQSNHADRFFVGKIDYIRYGKISEDNL